MNNDYDQKYNNQQNNQTSGWTAPESAYVYPDQSAGGLPPSHQRPPDRSSRTTRVIGIIALILAFSVVFSAVTGTLVYQYMKQQTEPTQESSGTTAPTETTGTVQTPPDNDLLNPHFSLYEAASRHEDGKETLTVMDIAKNGKPAVVAITTEMTVTDLFGQVYRPTAAGSGFIISEDGYIVTNNHVIEGADTISVVLDNDEIYEAELVGTDPTNDIAVIKIDSDDLPTVMLGDSSLLQVGELAIAIGNPLGELSGTVTAGIISALDREITLNSNRGPQRMKLLQTDAAINSGNSGGALFNSFGEVIGINTAKNTGTGVEGLGFAIPINHAKPIIESLIQYGYVRGRTQIGIRGQDINTQMAEYYKISEGILVIEVSPGSAAEKAGLQKEDIIIAANGQEAKTIDALNTIKNTLKPGDQLTLTIIRENREQKIDLVLQEELPDSYKPANYNRQADQQVEL